MAKSCSCSVCSEKCVTDCIYCETCKGWFNNACQNIDGVDAKLWEKTPLGYICIRCRSDDAGQLDFLMGIGRLVQAAKGGMKKMKVAVDREKLFLKDAPVENALHTDFSDHKQDTVSNFIISNYCSHTAKSALFSTGDGDCLFNSVSILLVGDESRSLELRYRCCVEMVSNKSKISVHRMYSKLETLSPDYDQECLECAQPGHWASAWMLIALSNLLNLPIKSVYPGVSGCRTAPFKALNHLFKPPFSDPEKGALTIMWTNTVAPVKYSFAKRQRPGSLWLPNHFVPLVDYAMREEVPPSSESEPAPEEKRAVNFTSVNRYDVLNECEQVQDAKTVAQEIKESGLSSTINNRTTKSRRSRHNNPKLARVKNENDASSDVSNISSTEATVIEDKEVDMRTSAKDDSAKAKIDAFNPEDVDQGNYTCDLSTIVEEKDVDTTTDAEYESPSQPVKDAYSPTTDNDADNEVETNSTLQQIGEVSPRLSDMFEEMAEMAEIRQDITEEDLPDDEIENTFQPGPLTKYMEIHELVQLLQSPYSVLDEIPRGRKDGMYYIIENTSNVERRKNGNSSQFWDDCGAWKNAKTPVTHYLNRNDRLRTVVKNSNGLYCIERQINKERVFIPIEPQPDDSEILELHRLYQNLVACQKGEPQFKRRFAWIEKVPINMPAIQTNVAVVEYIGEFPKRLMHGNVKKKENNTVYVRTKDSVIEDLKNQLKNDTVKTVARQMNLTTKDDFEKQRNDKQLRNLKHSINRAKKDHSETSNAADHVICVEEMTKSHPFVKTVKHISGINYPVVTLYTDQQIADIKRFCCKEGGSVLGMDKTFNLGEFHVTPTVYRDLSVVRRERNDGNPICIGPTFIHTSSTTKAYSSFMHDIADNFTDTELENLIIGTDEEAAFKSAISRCFPMSTHVLCSRHLKQNVNRHLEDQVGYPLRDRQDVLSKLFGEDGLAASKDIDTYNHRVTRIRELVNDKDSRVGEKKFQPYLDNKLLPLLSKHVAEPARNRKIPYNWTSNNSESANHILKKAVQWRIHDMPTFIKKLYSIVTGEQIERVRAIRGQGSFRLDTNFTHHLVDIDQWGSISDEQKERREARFLKDKGKTHPTIVVSTDGQRTVQIPASAGKKKNQTKRKRTDRTFTPRAKRKLHDINEDKD